VIFNQIGIIQILLFGIYNIFCTFNLLSSCISVRQVKIRINSFQNIYVKNQWALVKYDRGSNGIINLKLSDCISCDYGIINRHKRERNV